MICEFDELGVKEQTQVKAKVSTYLRSLGLDDGESYVLREARAAYYMPDGRYAGHKSEAKHATA